MRPSISKSGKRGTSGKSALIYGGIGAIVAIAGFLLNFFARRSMSFTDAVKQLHDGDPAAITELAAYDDKGLRALVLAIDPTGDNDPTHFPKQSVAIIKELRKHPKTLEQFRVELQTQRDANIRRIESVMTTMESELSKGVTPTGESTKQLDGLVEVAACLNRLHGNDPPRWSELSTRARVLLRELPVCGLDV